MLGRERLVRVLQMVSMIGSQFGATMADLVDSCEVSERTIYRDIDLLCKARYPVSFVESSRRYVFANSIFFRPLTFTTNEISVLLWAVEPMDEDEFPFAEGLSRNLCKCV